VNKVVSAVALALAAAYSGHAMAQTAPSATPSVKPFVGFGLTLGGDKLATAQYTNGDSASIHAGGLIQFQGGLEFAVGSAMSVSASVGYHVDRASADNGSLKFDRFPVELLAHYKLNDQWRVGAGVRLVNSATLGGSGVASIPDVEFDSTTGGVLQAEYMFSPKSSVVIRGVSEKYKVKGFTGSTDGSHFGVLLNYYFN
jgi:long-subunit fatty acid transport protein